MKSESMTELIGNDLERMIKKDAVTLVAVDGRLTSGKTTLAENLHNHYGYEVIHMDHFFLRPEQRTTERLGTPGGNVDYERFLDEIILPIQRIQEDFAKRNRITDGRETFAERPVFSYRPFSCRTGSLVDPLTVHLTPITIIEGSYCCHPELWEYYDYRIFLTVSGEEQLRRVREREGTDRLEVFKDRWIPLEERYFEAYGVEKRCDRVIRTDMES